MRPAPHAAAAPVLALHGSASSGRQWRHLQAALAETRSVLAPDLCGYGRRFGDPSDRLGQLTAILADMHQPVDVVAHSFGGAVALKLAALFPGRVRSLTLYEPLVPVRDNAGQTTLPVALRDLWLSVRETAPHGAMAQFLAFWDQPGAWNDLPREHQDRLVADYPAMMRDWEEVLRGYWTTNLATLATPMTVLRGNLSPYAVGDMCRKLLKHCPQTRLRTLGDLGHLAPMTAAGVVTPAILDALGTPLPAPPQNREAAQPTSSP